MPILILKEEQGRVKGKIIGDHLSIISVKYYLSIRMKAKRGNERDLDHITIPQKQRVPLGGNSAGITKRKDDRNNKENHIQITQSLQTLTYPSKEFILSRESLNRNSRLNLKDITQNQNSNIVQRPILSKKPQQREQETFDRRFSLKCTKVLSQQLESQKSHRLSVAPQRRESMTSNGLPQSLLDQRDSMSSCYQNSVLRREAKGKQDIKKQSIITNLMNKLDHEQDLRSIIETKLKGGLNSSQCLTKDRRNQSYITDFTEESSMSGLGSKLRQCENEIKYFKNVIKQMSQKIIQLTTEEKNFKKKDFKTNFPETNTNPSKNELTSLLRQLTNACSICDTCQQAKRSTKQIGIQTTNERETSSKAIAINESCDFFDNLQKTLKVLDGKKN